MRVKHNTNPSQDGLVDASYENNNDNDQYEFGSQLIEQRFSIPSRNQKRESIKCKKIEKKIKQLKVLKNPEVVVDCRVQIIEEERFLQVLSLENMKEDQIVQSLNSEEN